MNWRVPILVAGTVAAAWAADLDSVALLSRVRSKVLDNAKRIPRYICRQEIERQVYDPEAIPILRLAAGARRYQHRQKIGTAVFRSRETRRDPRRGGGVVRLARRAQFRHRRSR